MSAIIIPFPQRGAEVEETFEIGNEADVRYEPAHLVPAVVISAGLWVAIVGLVAALR